MVIIEARIGGKVVGRCDAKCYNAKGPDCHCICGGANHGVGPRIAIEDRQHIADQEIVSILCTSQGAHKCHVRRPQLQKELF